MSDTFSKVEVITWSAPLRVDCFSLRV
jgi:hypothetical protein